MNSFLGAHHFSLPTQGNIYSVKELHLTSGKIKMLVATLRRKVFICEFNESSDKLVPEMKEVPFTYIPSGADIISIDVFNRSKVFDDFYVGITITKIIAGQIGAENYLNIYTEQDVDEKSELNLDNLAQNCVMVEIPFLPYQLYHTLLVDSDNTNEIVWLLSGGDEKMHLYREDPVNHTYCESEIENLFPEFSGLPSIIVWVDIKYTSNFDRRLTAFGTESGLLKCSVIDVSSKDIIMDISENFECPISRVSFFYMKEEMNNTGFKTFEKCVVNKEFKNSINLLVATSLYTSIVFMDILEKGFKNKLYLKGSEKHDVTACACVSDVNMDSKMEILIGNYSKVLLMYTYENNNWKLYNQIKLSHCIHSINYADITGDGIKELFVLTMCGVDVFQHNLDAVKDKLKKRLKRVLRICTSNE